MISSKGLDAESFVLGNFFVLSRLKPFFLSNIRPFKLLFDISPFVLRTGVAIPPSRCESDLIQAPCGAKRLSTCDWIVLKSMSKVLLQRMKGFYLQYLSLRYLKASHILAFSS